MNNGQNNLLALIEKAKKIINNDTTSEFTVFIVDHLFDNESMNYLKAEGILDRINKNSLIHVIEIVYYYKVLEHTKKDINRQTFNYFDLEVFESEESSEENYYDEEYFEDTTNNQIS